jgi:hypothetical protein
MQARDKAPITRLRQNVPRVVEAILRVVTEASRRNMPLTQYDIVKTIFLADKAHLNKYGRPVTFDSYVAMRDGPVPSLAYDLLKDKQEAVRKVPSGKLPWQRTPAPELGRTVYLYHTPERGVDGDILSPSDLSALGDALTTIQSLTFSQIRRLTHEDPAYVDAWDDTGERKQYPISYGLLFETPDFEKAERIRFISEHI